MRAQVTGSAESALTPITMLVGATVTGSDGSNIGTIADVMMATGRGAIVYVALSVGGLAGIGERMFAVPWTAFIIDPVAATLRVAFSRTDLDGRPGFDKDAWPVAADATLAIG